MNARPLNLNCNPCKQGNLITNMECSRCHGVKLAKEFPWEPLSNCHCEIPSVCVKCIYDTLQQNSACPLCDGKLTIEENESVQEQAAILYNLVTSQKQKSNSQETGVVSIQLIDGQSIYLNFDATTTIIHCKLVVATKLNLKPENMCLYFEESELKVRTQTKTNHYLTKATTRITISSTTRILLYHLECKIMI